MCSFAGFCSSVFGLSLGLPVAGWSFDRVSFSGGVVLLIWFRRFVCASFSFFAEFPVLPGYDIRSGVFKVVWSVLLLLAEVRLRWIYVFGGCAVDSLAFSAVFLGVLECFSLLYRFYGFGVLFDGLGLCFGIKFVVSWGLCLLGFQLLGYWARVLSGYVGPLLSLPVWFAIFWCCVDGVGFDGSASMEFSFFHGGPVGGFSYSAGVFVVFGICSTGV